MRVLLVEDDRVLAAEVSRAIEREGFTVEQTGLGKEAMAFCDSLPPSLVVLDMGLPDMDGGQVLRHIRRSRKDLPVLILTARDSVDDKVRALDGGADDYLAKPFDMPELLARLRVLARRLGTSSSSLIESHGVTLDLAAHTANCDGSPLALSRREYMVLKSLMENLGRVQTKEMLEDKLYGWGDEVASNAIEVHISNLRKKLPGDMIKTIRGVGYVIGK